MIRNDTDIPVAIPRNTTLGLIKPLNIASTFHFQAEGRNLTALFENLDTSDNEAVLPEGFTDGFPVA